MHTTQEQNITLSQRPTVYLIDDDDNWRNAVTQSFKAIRIPVKCYPTAESFLSDNIDETAGCLVIELNLPDLNGIELLKKLNNRGLHIPAILTATSSDIRSAVKAMQANALDFMEKPLHEKNLVSHVTKVLESTVAVRD